MADVRTKALSALDVQAEEVFRYFLDYGYLVYQFVGMPHVQRFQEFLGCYARELLTADSLCAL